MSKLSLMLLNIAVDLCLPSLNENFIKIPLYRAKKDQHYKIIKSPGVVDRSVHRDVLHGQPGLGYYTVIGIGTPPQYFNILIDTGSSNFAVACTPQEFVTSYFNTSTSSTYQDEKTEVEVKYTKGEWKGNLIADVIRLKSHNRTSVKVYIACIKSSSLFFLNNTNWQGILGLAYNAISKPDSSVVPALNSLLKTLSYLNIVSLQLCGKAQSDSEATEGQMVLGGIDETLFYGTVLYAILNRAWYYDVIITGIKIDGESLAIQCNDINYERSIIDSGTTLLRFPADVYSVVMNVLQEKFKPYGLSITQEFWNAEVVLCWDIALPMDSFPKITLSLAESHNTTFSLVLSAYHYFRSITDDAQAGDYCYEFGITSSDTGTVLGAVVLEGLFVVLDKDHGRVGFANSTCIDLNNTDPKVFGPFPSSTSPLDCANSDTIILFHKVLLYAAYCIAGLCVTAFIILLCRLIYISTRRNTEDTSSIPSETPDEKY